MDREMRCLNTFIEKKVDDGKTKKKKPSPRVGCEFRKQQMVDGKQVYICTGKGYCPFREDISELIKRESTPKKTRGGK